jgi:glycosyltransferase involved in cell wall biosynthesis
MRKLLLIGPVPEPRGGVSVHLMRLAQLLQQHGVEVRFVDESPVVKPNIPNLRRGAVLAYVRNMLWADIVHVHSSNPVIRLTHVYAARLLGRRVVVTIHSAREMGWRHLISQWAVDAAVTRVFVSREIEARFDAPGVILPAFLPPASDELSVERDVDEWISRRKSEGRRIVASNASTLAVYNGQDLYGLDIIIGAFSDSAINVRFACIFFISATRGREDYLAACKAEIGRRNLSGVLRIVTMPSNFVGAAARSDIIVRATNTDGDAISVREALHLGKVVIASDCVARPPGTLLFKTRDIDDLKRVLLAAPLEVPSPTPFNPYIILKLYGA